MKTTKQACKTRTAKPTLSLSLSHSHTRICTQSHTNTRLFTVHTLSANDDTRSVRSTPKKKTFFRSHKLLLDSSQNSKVSVGSLLTWEKPILKFKNTVQDMMIVPN